MRVRAFPYLLLPHLWSSRNRARRRERGDFTRGAAVRRRRRRCVCAALFYGAFWLTWQLDDYDELGDYLLRLGLSWLFLTFLAFLAFSGIVTALSTFFLSDDLRLLLAAPVAARRLFYARFTRTVVQSSWMVVVFVAPVLLGVGLARCAPVGFYVTSALTIVPFAVIPVAVGTACTLLLVNMFPARRARDMLMLMGLLFAASIVILLRMIRPEQLLQRRIAARRHRLLRDAAVADDAAAAVVLGGRDAVRQPAGRMRSRCMPARSGQPRWRCAWYCEPPSERWHFSGLQPVAGSAEGTLHEVPHARRRSRARCRCRRCGGSCWSRI